MSWIHCVNIGPPTTTMERYTNPRVRDGIEEFDLQRQLPVCVRGRWLVLKTPGG